MPLVLRKVEPKYLSRQVVTVSDNELEAVSNDTLTNVLRQLASLVSLASEIFDGLAENLQTVYQRSCSLRAAIDRVDSKLAEFNPKTVTVPESDISTFAQRTRHYNVQQPLDTALFTTASRPDTICRLYEAAAPTPVRTIRSLDQFRRDGTRSSKLFVCTPVLQGRRKRWRKVDLDIETRKPSAVDDLRKWTSTEALGDVTVQPDNTIVVSNHEAPVDHLLPSPEEQMMAVAQRFPACVVPVDVSGRAFDRLSTTRRSLTNIQIGEDGATATRRKRSRRRDKRRNTLAGTSHKEIEAAMAGETTTETEGVEFEPLAPLRAGSGELFKPRFGAAEQFKNQLLSLKQWSRGKLRSFARNHGQELSSSKPSFQASDLVDDDVMVYERINGVRRVSDKAGSSTSVDTSIVVRLRENSLQRRNRRAGMLKGKDEPVHSSSGNWSASSESGRTSIASETTTAPKSTSTATSTNSLHPSSVQSRRRVLASGSSSISEGTLTPDINDIDGETSSVYSCDTEGYYTSFHVDSGLKTLKEEDIGLSASSLRLDDTQTFPNFQPQRAQMTAENEYELFGKGSTSTTTSSAGTVCTTLLAGHTLGSRGSLSGFAPAVPERKSSLDRKERPVVLVPDSPSPDSGHNTSSSPGDSTGQVESDLEGERVERIRNKTAITVGRIPSMVAITPPISDEEIGPQAPLRIAIPDVYALPDKRKHAKTTSMNGVLETSLDEAPKHYTVNRETDYVSLNSIVNDNSLERRRQGARVTLDSEGKVVYASDSLKRKKDHSTFVPGKFVRDEPTPSPVLGQRTPKPIRPIQKSGLVRTNGDVSRRSISPKDDRRSPRLGKIFVRSPVRIVSPTNSLEHPKDKKRTSPALSKSSTDYEEVDGRWISQHPSASSQKIQAAQAAATAFPRSHPMYWTLQSRPRTEKSSTPTKTTDRSLDLTLSPIKSPKTTMTTEELFAAIHKSKKKLNIPKSNEPSSKNDATNPTATSPRTSLQNFKMLLLQKGSKDEKRISAVEQLRLSKGVKTCESPKKMTKKWRFASPRSDVLSSTIQEDCTELEKFAAVPSPAFVGAKAQRALPEPPQYQSRLTTNSIYAKITAPLQKTPERLNLNRNAIQARRDFFADSQSPPSAVPYNRRFSPFPMEAAKVEPFSNHNASRQFPNRALTPRRSPNVSLETAL